MDYSVQFNTPGALTSSYTCNNRLIYTDSIGIGLQIDGLVYIYLPTRTNSFSPGRRGYIANISNETTATCTAMIMTPW